MSSHSTKKFTGSGKTNRRTHGMSGTRTYRIWKIMIQRATNPNQINAKNYIGRGIKVCERWRHSFEAFLEDMGVCPSNKYSIDRFPNNDGNYEPSNCRWATAKEQARNSRSATMVTFNGKTQCIKDWAAEVGIGEGTIAVRLRAGWDVERALTESTEAWKRSITFNGRTMSLIDWSKEVGIPRRTLNRRLNGGWSIERVLFTQTR